MFKPDCLESRFPAGIKYSYPYKSIKLISVRSVSNLVLTFDILRMFLFLTLLLISVLNVSGSPSSSKEAGKMTEYLNRVNTQKFMIR